VKKFLFVVLTGVIGFLLLSNGSSGRKVTADEFGENWPFTIREGVVDCVDDLAYIFVANGKTYALNGFAKVWKISDTPLKRIWKRDPKYPDLKLYINIGQISDAAASEC